MLLSILAASLWGSVFVGKRVTRGGEGAIINKSRTRYK